MDMFSNLKNLPNIIIKGMLNIFAIRFLGLHYKEASSIQPVVKTSAKCIVLIGN